MAFVVDVSTYLVNLFAQQTSAYWTAPTITVTHWSLLGSWEMHTLLLDTATILYRKTVIALSCWLIVLINVP